MHLSRNTGFLTQTPAKHELKIWLAAACERASKHALLKRVHCSLSAVGLTLGLGKEGLVAERRGGGRQPRGEWLSGSLPLWSSLQQPSDTQQQCRDNCVHSPMRTIFYSFTHCLAPKVMWSGCGWVSAVDKHTAKIISASNSLFSPCWVHLSVLLWVQKGSVLRHGLWICGLIPRPGERF